MTTTHKIALALLCCTLLGIVSSMDYQDHQQYEEHRCNMVALWLSDEALGVPPMQRRGWPDYNDNYGAVCAGRE